MKVIHSSPHVRESLDVRVIVSKHPERKDQDLKLQAEWISLCVTTEVWLQGSIDKWMSDWTGVELVFINIIF